MFDSGFLNTIVLLGSMQGFILACLLFGSKNNKPANRLLASLIFLIALACLNLYLTHQNWYDSTPVLRLISAMVPLIIIMPLGPLVYLYVRSSVDPYFTFTKKHWIYFYPVILDLVPQITAWAYVTCLLAGVVKKNDVHVGNFIDSYNTYIDIPRWVSLTFYLYLSARYLSAVI